MDTVKYFNTNQINLLRREARNNFLLAQSKNQPTAIREWMALDLLTQTGMRVSEIVDLRCGDINCRYGESEVYVRSGKGSKPRTIQIQESLKTHIRQFIAWKREIGESVGENDFIFIGQRGPWSRQAVQLLVKKYLKQLGLYEKGKSVHALRHSYATELYKNSSDLRAVQKQLGHASITTTQVYADVTKAKIQEHLAGMWRNG
jgi:site-specific recombinase XerD